MRCDMGRDYFDEEFEDMVRKQYPGNPYPFGIYL
jgi:hypothetical protein